MYVLNKKENEWAQIERAKKLKSDRLIEINEERIKAKKDAYRKDLKKQALIAK